MRRVIALGVVGLGLCAAQGALAQDTQPGMSAGYTLTSDYISYGRTNSDGGPALQGYVYAFSDGFYAGAWASTVDLGNDDDLEVDLTLGYSNALDFGLRYDVGYGHYFYNSSGNCCGEFFLKLAMPVTDTITARGQTLYDPDAEAFNSNVGFDARLNDRFAVSGTLGEKQASHSYGDIGISYNLNAATSLDLRYHDASGSDSRVAVGFSQDFQFGGF